jgi:hypothetical protein
MLASIRAQSHTTTTLVLGLGFDGFADREKGMVGKGGGTRRRVQDGAGVECGQRLSMRTKG